MLLRLGFNSLCANINLEILDRIFDIFKMMCVMHIMQIYKSLLNNINIKKYISSSWWFEMSLDEMIILELWGPPVTSSVNHRIL